MRVQAPVVTRPGVHTSSYPPGHTHRRPLHSQVPPCITLLLTPGIMKRINSGRRPAPVHRSGPGVQIISLINTPRGCSAHLHWAHSWHVSTPGHVARALPPVLQYTAPRVQTIRIKAQCSSCAVWLVMMPGQWAVSAVQAVSPGSRHDTTIWSPRSQYFIF